MATKISLDKKRMHVTNTHPSGVVDSDTIFEFTQEDEVVHATYKGGGVKLGFLIGKLTGKDLEFRYTQIQTNGVLDGGHSMCKVRQTVDGIVRIEEHFEWESRQGEGINIFEEV
jgi:hypothetical protein